VDPHPTPVASFAAYSDFATTSLHATDPRTPFVTTLPPLATRTNVTLKGEANSTLRDGTVMFEWGTSATALTNVTPAQALQHGRAATGFEHVLNGLPAGQQHYYRARFDYDGITTRGGVQKFVIGNHAPVARGDYAFTPANSIATILVTANDSDSDGDTLTITEVEGASFGGVGVLPDGRGVQYAPVSGFTGYDTFSYTISDGFGGEATTTVSVSVGDNRPSELLTKVIASTGATGFFLSDGTSADSNVIATGFGPPAISDNRETVALMRYRAGRSFGSAIFHQDSAGLQSLPAYTGGAAPGIANATFTALRDPLISPAGFIAFWGRYRTSTTTSANDESIYTNWDGSIEPVLSEGYALPGALPTNITIRSITSFSLRDLEIIALVRLAGVGVNSGNDTALVHLQPSGNRLFARTGSPLNTGGVMTAISDITALGTSPGTEGHGRTHGDFRSVFRVTLSDGRQAIVDAVPVSGNPLTLLAISDTQIAGAGTYRTFGVPAISQYGNGYVWRASSTSRNELLYSLYGTSVDGSLPSLFPVPGVPGATMRTFGEPVVNLDQNVAFTSVYLGGPGIGGIIGRTGIFCGPITAPGRIASTGDLATDRDGAEVAGRKWSRFQQLALPNG
jgi:hypothetical protein